MNQTTLQPFRILVVDDDEEIRTAITKLLQKDGYSVTTQADALGAVRCLARSEEPFDLVITDVVMPGLSGMELLRLLKAESSDQPVIIITAFGDGFDYTKARSKGAFEYLCKPLENDVLLSVVRRALKRRNNHATIQEPALH